MLFLEKEHNEFSKIVIYINALYKKHQNKTALFRFVYAHKVIEARYDTMFETDNGEELDSPDYDEYNAILFENLKTRKLFEINYKNLPKELYCNGERIL